MGWYLSAVYFSINALKVEMADSCRRRLTSWSKFNQSLMKNDQPFLNVSNTFYIFHIYEDSIDKRNCCIVRTNARSIAKKRREKEKKRKMWKNTRMNFIDKQSQFNQERKIGNHTIFKGAFGDRLILWMWVLKKSLRYFTSKTPRFTHPETIHEI